MDAKLTYPVALSPTSFMKGCFLTSLRATWQANSLFGRGLTANICVTRSLTISFLTEWVRAIFRLSTVGLLIQSIIVGRQVSGIMNASLFIIVDADEEMEKVSSEACERGEKGD